ncbi:hypothetical protein D3C79_637920 [compost metagenome]
MVQPVADRLQLPQQAIEVTRHRDAAHRLDAHAVPAQEAGGAEREVAAHRIGPRVQAIEFDQLQILARLDLGLAVGTCAKHQVARAHVQRATGAARRRAVALKAEVVGGGAVVQQGLELPLANQQQIPGGGAFTIEGLDLHSARHMDPALQGEPAGGHALADLVAPGVDPLLGPLARQRGLEAAEQAGQAVEGEEGAVATALHGFPQQQAVGHGMDLLDEGSRIQLVEAARILPLIVHGLAPITLEQRRTVATDAELPMLAEAALAVGEPEAALPFEEAVVGGAGHIGQGEHVRLEAQGQGYLLLHRGAVGLVDLGAVGVEVAVAHPDSLVCIDLGETAGVERILQHGIEGDLIQGFRVGDADPAILDEADAELLAAGDLVFPQLTLVGLEGEGPVLVGDEVRLGAKIGNLVEQLAEQMIHIELAHQALPPTRILSTLSCGWPTEAGMEPETEPHMPAEMARSRPTMEISLST